MSWKWVVKMCSLQNHEIIELLRLKKTFSNTILYQAPAAQSPSCSQGPRTQNSRCQVPGGDHCPGPTVCNIADTGQNVIGLSGYLGTCWLKLFYCWPASPGPFLLSSFPATLPPAFSTAWGCVGPNSQDLTLHHVNPHTIGFCPSFLI